MRLIDADKLAEQYAHPNELVYTFDILDRIKNAPTVETEQVVHCKDCIFSMVAYRTIRSKGKTIGALCCAAPVDTGLRVTDQLVIVDDDWYCADGERRPEK